MSCKPLQKSLGLPDDFIILVVFYKRAQHVFQLSHVYRPRLIFVLF